MPRFSGIDRPVFGQDTLSETTANGLDLIQIVAGRKHLGERRAYERTVLRIDVVQVMQANQRSQHEQRHVSRLRPANPIVFRPPPGCPHTALGFDHFSRLTLTLSTREHAGPEVDLATFAVEIADRL